MSCRHHSDNPSPGSVLDAPCSVRKWQRWPNRLPRACNDNPGTISTQFRALLGAALGGLLTLATVFSALTR
jgi:hypothetical protein